MKRNLLIRGARQLVTLHGVSGPRRGDAMRELGVIEDGSALIVNGVISSVGPTRRIENLAEARSAEEINANGRVVIPGFVDSHTHLIAPSPRASWSRRDTSSYLNGGLGLQSFQSALQYMRTTAGGTLEFQAKKHLSNLLRHGTTSVEVKTGYGLVPGAEMKILRIMSGLADEIVDLTPTLLGPYVLPPEFTSPEQFIASLCADTLPRVRERKSARFVDVLCDPRGFSPVSVRPWLEAAGRLGLGIKMHADQHGRAGAAVLAVEFNAVSADGLNEIEDADAEILGRSQTICTLLPGEAHHGIVRRMPPARVLIDAGAAVALGSGFDPSSWSVFNMQAVISLACTHMQMTPEEALTAATVNGAYALGRGGRSGSLEFGREADIVLLNVSDYREIPLYFGSNLVAAVLRKGEIVYREGALTCGGA